MRTFAGITPQSFAGRLVAKPTHIRDTKFSQQPPLPPSTLGVVLDWVNQYGASTANPNVGVNINIPVGGPRQTLDTIRSVRIDNTGNPVPVYVQFPDVPYIVVAPPNTVVWEPVETGQFNATIYGIGFTTGQIGLTAVYFCNFSVNPLVNNEIPQSVDLWKASATITRGNTILNQNFGTPALGDQKQAATIDLTTLSTFNIFFTPLPSGFIYLTYMDINIFNVSDPALIVGQVILESTGSSGALFSHTFGVGLTKITNQTILRWRANVKLDATQLWRFRNNIVLGSGTFHPEFVYTINPT